MKKMISIMLAGFVAFSSALSLAYAERPDRITAMSSVDATVNSPEQKVSATVSSVTLADTSMRHNSFGQTAAILDGIGMIGSHIDNDDSKAIITEGMGTGTAVPTGTNRLVIKANNLLSLTINLTNAISISEIKWTEARKEIAGVSVELYKNGTLLATKTKTFSDGTASNNVYLRNIDLQEKITVDKIVFEVTSLYDTSNVISITEMEFWLRDIREVSVDKATLGSFGTIDSIFDGIGMIGSHIDNDDSKAIITDGTTTSTAIPNAKTRWVASATNVKPTITVSFTEDKSINQIKWTEARQIIGEIEVRFYKDDVLVSTKTGSPNTSDPKTSDDNFVYLKTVTFDELVTADKVVIEVTSLLRTDKNMSITEMVFRQYLVVSAPTITDSTSATVTRAAAGYEIDKAFDGIFNQNNGDYTKFLFNPFDNSGNNIYTLPITISFDLGSSKTFNYAELTELRCALGTIDVYVSDDASSYTKVGTMSALDYDGDTSKQYTHYVSFDTVTKRYVKYVINEMATLATLQANGSTAKAVTISEISLYNFPVDEETEAVIYTPCLYGTEINGTVANLLNVNTHITLNNIFGSSKTYMISVPVLDSTETDLIYVDVKNITLGAGESKTISISNYQRGAHTGDKCKFFAWEDVIYRALTEDAAVTRR